MRATGVLRVDSGPETEGRSALDAVAVWGVRNGAVGMFEATGGRVNAIFE